MHEYTGHFDSGQNPQVNPDDGSAKAQASPMPGTEPIPDAAAGTPPEGSPKPRRVGSGSRFHAGLPSWDTRAKLAVVVSFVVLVTVLVMNRPRLKGKSPSTPLAEITQRPSEPKPDDPGAAKEETVSPPAAPMGDRPPGKPATIPTASETLPKEPTDEPRKPPAQVVESKEDVPPIDPPVPKPAERSVEVAAIADAPVPSIDDKKPRDEAVPADDRTPRLSQEKPSTADPAEAVPTKPIADEPPAEAASMPPLSKAPSTAEAVKPATADTPVVDSAEPATPGRFPIPSAGLVRTSGQAVKKPSANEAASVALAAAAPASVPGTGNDDGTLHVVRKGENFWTIARYHYASGRFYKALWYANRDLAKTPEDLYVGTAIRIPPVEDLNRELIDAPKTARAEPRPSASAPARKGPPRDGSAERAAAEGEPQAALPVNKSNPGKPIPRRAEARPKPEATYRTYVVRGRNETLRSVARTQLGDSDRDAEIEALNRDEFSDDTNRLKVGMTLKLPNDSRVR